MGFRINYLISGILIAITIATKVEAQVACYANTTVYDYNNISYCPGNVTIRGSNVVAVGLKNGTAKIVAPISNLNVSQSVNQTLLISPGGSIDGLNVFGAKNFKFIVGSVSSGGGSSGAPSLPPVPIPRLLQNAHIVNTDAEIDYSGVAPHPADARLRAIELMHANVAMRLVNLDMDDLGISDSRVALGTDHTQIESLSATSSEITGRTTPEADPVHMEQTVLNSPEILDSVISEPMTNVTVNGGTIAGTVISPPTVANLTFDGVALPDDTQLSDIIVPNTGGEGLVLRHVTGGHAPLELHRMTIYGFFVIEDTGLMHIDISDLIIDGGTLVIRGNNLLQILFIRNFVLINGGRIIIDNRGINPQPNVHPLLVISSGTINNPDAIQIYGGEYGSVRIGDIDADRQQIGPNLTIPNIHINGITTGILMEKNVAVDVNIEDTVAASHQIDIGLQQPPPPNTRPARYNYDSRSNLRQVVVSNSSHSANVAETSGTPHIGECVRQLPGPELDWDVDDDASIASVNCFHKRDKLDQFKQLWNKYTPAGDVGLLHHILR